MLKMNRIQWEVLAGGFIVIGIILDLIKMYYLTPILRLSQSISPIGTSNLEVIANLSSFILMIISFSFVASGLLFFIIAWLEKK